DSKLLGSWGRSGIGGDGVGVVGEAGFGDAAVVDDDLGGLDGGVDAGAGFFAGFYEDAGGAFAAGDDDGDGDFGGGGAGVLDGDGGEELSAENLTGVGADDFEIGEAAVAVDPVIEKPLEILFGFGFDELLEVGGVVIVGGLVAGDGGGEGVIADHVAEHG